jgi:hypothetical protein
MRDTVLAINATVARDATVKVRGLAKKVQAAMNAVLLSDFYQATDDEMFQGVIVGVGMALKQDGPEYHRLKDTIAALKNLKTGLDAAAAGISVDIPALLSTNKKWLPLGRWWIEAKRKYAEKHPQFQLRGFSRH